MNKNFQSTLKNISGFTGSTRNGIISPKRWVLGSENKTTFQRRQSEAIERSIADATHANRMILKNGVPIVKKTKILSMSPSRTLMNIEQDLIE